MTGVTGRALLAAKAGKEGTGKKAPARKASTKSKAADADGDAPKTKKSTGKAAPKKAATAKAKKAKE